MSHILQRFSLRGLSARLPKSISWSYVVLIGILLYCLLKAFETKKYKEHGDWNMIYSDMFLYYNYLPAAFIYHDLDFGYYERLPLRITDHYTPKIAANGAKVNKVTFGMAILYSPFFAIGHLLTSVLCREEIADCAPDGYSRYYRMALYFGSMLYVALGCWVLRRILRKFFEDSIVAWTLVGIALGTNLYFYTVYEGMMTHGYSFMLFTLLLWNVVQWYERPRYRYAISIGVVLGFIALIRPTNLLISIFPLVYGVYNIRTWQQRWQYWQEHWRQLLAAFLVMSLVISTQLLFWKWRTGSWVFSSYGNERFFWDNPQFLKGFFGYRKGWFLYTPLAAFMVMGIAAVWYYAKAWFYPLLLFTLLNCYVVLSWWSWWYGGGFGLRAFIESYAPLAVALAAFLHYCRRSSWSWIGARLLVALLVVFNLFQTYQYRKAIIHWDSMTEKTYWGVFLKKEITPEYRDSLWQYIDPPNNDIAK